MQYYQIDMNRPILRFRWNVARKNAQMKYKFMFLISIWLKNKHAIRIFKEPNTSKRSKFLLQETELRHNILQVKL